MPQTQRPAITMLHVKQGGILNSVFPINKNLCNCSTSRERTGANGCDTIIQVQKQRGSLPAIGTLLTLLLTYQLQEIAIGC